MNSSPRIAFFGTPELCLPILEALDQAGFTPVLIGTNPDRPVGRKQIITPPPVKTWAQEHNITVLQPEKITPDVITEISSYNLDLSIVVAYGQIMPQALIDLPAHGTLNLHYSLLPRHRGAAPVEAAILAGDTETGVTIQQMVFKLDAGPIVAIAKHHIADDILAKDLRDELNAIGAQLLIDTIPDYVAGKISPVEQDHTQANYFNKINKSDAEIKLSDPDIEKWRKYRAYYGWPRVHYFDDNGKRVIITEAAWQDGKFVIKKILPEGGKEISVF
jgi:methionyl-tRNA formyltransferase